MFDMAINASEASASPSVLTCFSPVSFGVLIHF